MTDDADRQQARGLCWFTGRPSATARNEGATMPSKQSEAVRRRWEVSRLAMVQPPDPPLPARTGRALDLVSRRAADATIRQRIRGCARRGTAHRAGPAGRAAPAAVLPASVRTTRPAHVPHLAAPDRARWHHTPTADRRGRGQQRRRRRGHLAAGPCRPPRPARPGRFPDQASHRRAVRTNECGPHRLTVQTPRASR